MDIFGVVVIGVLVASVLVALFAARNPVRWDELGGGSPLPQDGSLPTPADDEAELRALVEAKRARRQNANGPAVASDNRPFQVREGDWAHLDAELVSDARSLVTRRRARLERTGQPVPDEHTELVRLLGPPSY